MKGKKTEGIIVYILHFKNSYYIIKNIRLKQIFIALGDDNNAVLKFSLQRVFKSGYRGLNFVLNKAYVAELQFAWYGRPEQPALKYYL